MKRLMTALNKIHADDEPLSFACIVEISGLGNGLWCMRVEPQHSDKWRKFAIDCSRRVQHLMADSRSLAALDLAEKHACGEATCAEIRKAWSAAWAAWAKEDTAAWAARDGARGANSTWCTKRAAADAAKAAANAVSAALIAQAKNAADAAKAALDASVAEQDAAMAFQTELFLKLVNGQHSTRHD